MESRLPFDPVSVSWLKFDADVGNLLGGGRVGKDLGCSFLGIQSQERCKNLGAIKPLEILLSSEGRISVRLSKGEEIEISCNIE